MVAFFHELSPLQLSFSNIHCDLLSPHLPLLGAAFLKKLKFFSRWTLFLHLIVFWHQFLHGFRIKDRLLSHPHFHELYRILLILLYFKPVLYIFQLLLHLIFSVLEVGEAIDVKAFQIFLLDRCMSSRFVVWPIHRVSPRFPFLLGMWPF